MRAVFVALLLLPLLARAEDANETACRKHLKNLGGALKAYRLINNDKSPAKISELYTAGLADSLGEFVCPASGATITAASEIDAKTDYELSTGDELVRETSPHHTGDQVLVLMKDGSIKPVTVPGAARSQPTVAPTAQVNRPATPETPTTPTAEEEQPLPPVIAPQMPPPGTTTPTTPPAPPLGSRPVGAYLGARVTDVQNGKGAYVVELVPQSPAEAGGLKPGDVIMALNGDPIDTSRELVDALTKLSPSGRLDLLVWRNAKMWKLSFSPAARPANP